MIMSMTSFRGATRLRKRLHLDAHTVEKSGATIGHVPCPQIAVREVVAACGHAGRVALRRGRLSNGSPHHGQRMDLPAGRDPRRVGGARAGAAPAYPVSRRIVADACADTTQRTDLRPHSTRRLYGGEDVLRKPPRLLRYRQSLPPAATAANGAAGSFPAVLAPHGHAPYGRLEASDIFNEPARAASLARQGYVVFSFGTASARSISWSRCRMSIARASPHRARLAAGRRRFW